MQSFHGKTNLLIDELKMWKKKNYRTLILSGNEERGKRLVQSLNDLDINAIL